MGRYGIVIAAVLVLFVVTRAEAFIIVDVDYTGNVAQKFDLGGYSFGVGSFPSYIGGSIANNSLGGALQFTVDQAIHIDYLLASAHIGSDFIPSGETTSAVFDFKLYTNSLTSTRGLTGPYPDINTLAVATPMLVSTSTEEVFIPELGIYHTFNRDGYYVDVPLRFDITLDPGTYWLARERHLDQSGPIVDGIAVKLAVVPEPATFLLFGGGMAGLLARQKRRKA